MAEEIREVEKDPTLNEDGSPNTDDKTYIPSGPGHGLDPRLGHKEGASIHLSPNGDGSHDPGVTKQDLEGIGPGHPKKGGPGWKE